MSDVLNNDITQGLTYIRAMEKAREHLTLAEQEHGHWMQGTFASEGTQSRVALFHATMAQAYASYAAAVRTR